MQANILLDPSKPYDEQKVQILDHVVAALYSGQGAKVVEANTILEAVQADPNFWMQCESVLRFSQNWNTKFMCLLALEENIKTKWAIITADQREVIKKFIVNLVFKITENNDVNRDHRNILSKCNSILVHIIKQEWDSTWPSAIKDLAESCKQNQTLCENNLEIMLMLSEEIFEDTKQNMTKVQLDRLKERYNENLKIIYDLCDYISKAYIQDQSKISPSLIKMCLKMFYAFLSWAPTNLIFGTDFLDVILVGLMGDIRLTVQCLQCFTESYSIPLNDFTKDELVIIRKKLFDAFTLFTHKIHQILPVNRQFRAERQEKMKNHNQLTLFDSVTKEVALYFISVVKHHFNWMFDTTLELYRNNNRQWMDICQLLESMLKYMVNMSDVDHDTLYKICIDFWLAFTNKRVQIEAKLKTSTNNSFNGLKLDNSAYDAQEVFKKIFDSDSFNSLFKIIVRKMPRPQEVLIETDEHGVPKKVTVENTENTNLFNMVQATLANMAKINWESMSMIIYNMINQQNYPENFSPEFINSLSWAVGALNGTLSEVEEKQYLNLILRNLLSLNDIKKSQNDRAVVVTNILYIAGQYPRTLNSNWCLLSVLLDKLSEFMEYDFPGLSDMACNCYLKVCQSCKEQLTKNHSKKDTEKDPIKKALDPAVWDIFKNIGNKIQKLNLQNKLIYYEAIGVILSAIKDDNVLVEAIRVALNQLITGWKSFIASVGTNSEKLRQDETLLNISFFINVNEKLNGAIKDRYGIVFEVIFGEMVIIYDFYTNTCQQEFASNKGCLTFYNFKKMRAVKRDILRMFAIFIEHTTDKQGVATKYLPQLFNILKNYVNEPEQLREAEMLLLFSKVIEVFGPLIAEYVPNILECIFGSTLSLISSDFSSYPDHRVNFFVFLKTVVETCFQALLSVPKEQLETVINCMIWSIKHELSNIYEVGLESLLALITKVNTNVELANSFYKVYYMRIFTDVLIVLTDRLHANGFDIQMQILRTLITVLDHLQVRLSDSEADNRRFVMLTLFGQMSAGFPNLSQEDHQRNLQRLFTSYKTEADFKSDLNDYLIQLELYTNTAIVRTN